MASSTDVEHYDLVVIGSGEAGKFIPWVISTKQGKRCAVIERKWFGGSCPNVACLPSKNVIHSAKVHHINSQRHTYGLSKPDGNETFDMGPVKQKRTAITDGMIETMDSVFKEKKVDFIWGDAKFTGPKTIEVSDADGKKKTYSADIVIVNTGSRAIVQDISGLRAANPMTNVELLDMDQLPNHLVIVGGGYIGLEFAQAFRRFGSKVSVLEHGAKTLKREDDDVASQLVEVLEKEGIEFHTSTSITEVSGKSGDSVTLKGTKDSKPFEITGSHVLCATGRLPNNEDIGLELAGVKLTNKGFIEVDEWNRATNDGVFAVGDCAGSPFFTHASLDDYRIVCEYLLNDKKSENRRSQRQIPFTLFTDPELAHVGLREKEAKAQGLNYRLAKVPMAAFLRTRTLGDTTGFAKAIVSAEDDTILGFTALGPGAGELLPVVQLAMKRKLPYADISDLIIAHPTLNEGLIALFDETPPRS